jgi:diguanylate cyclase (GGDEF)-like protein
MPGSVLDSTRHRRSIAARLHLRRRSDRIWSLNLALVGLTVWLFLGPVAGAPPLARPHLPWWLIALAFAAAERCVVHLHFRGGAHSFSLSDVPLVFGLIFCRGDDLVLAWVLGSLLVLAFDRRLPPIKLIFNVSQFGLSAAVAVLMIHALAPATGQVEMGTWLAALLATQVSGLVTALLIAAAISLAEGLIERRRFGQMVAMDAAVTISNSSLGVCGVLVTAADPRALPLLGVPFGTLFLAYRAYLSERERQHQLEFVHDANRALATSHEVTDALETLLERSLEAFRTEAVEMILLGSDQRPPLRTLLRVGGTRELMQRIDHELADQIRDWVVDAGRATVIERPLAAEAVDRYLQERGFSNAVAAPLRGEGQVFGTIMLANRTGVECSFGSDDLKLLETLANNVSAAIEFDRLGHAVRQLSVARDQLQHEASHDSLTGLTTRAPFVERVREEIRLHPRDLAVLFVDLDNFKTVNDTLGHGAGDELLIQVAQRLLACVREHDVVARIGGDEFAVVIRGGADARTAAVSVARRMVEACQIDVGAEQVAISVHASVGVALCGQRRITAEELISEADAAMYSAKHRGKGRFQLSGTHRVAAERRLNDDRLITSLSHKEVVRT